MKRKVSIITALALSALMLVSCGKKDGGSADNAKENAKITEQAKDMVGDYLEAIKENDTEKVSGLMAATASNNSAIADFYDIADSLKESIAAMAGDDAAEEIFQSALSLAADRISYEITDAKETGDGTVSVAADLTVPDFDTVNIDDLDMMSVMQKCFGTTDSEALINEFAKRKGMSVSELMSAYDSREAMVADLLEVFKPEMTAFFDELVGGVQTTVKAANFTVKKQDDGSWKIVSVD